MKTLIAILALSATTAQASPKLDALDAFINCDRKALSELSEAIADKLCESQFIKAAKLNGRDVVMAAHRALVIQGAQQ